jgi:hypothetical protein
MLENSPEEQGYKFSYKPGGETLKNFLKDNSFVRGMRGPVGSGKSVSCCIEVMRRACEQEPDKNGVRRSRWGVIRNTNPQLKTTTIKTWLDWYPENIFGVFKWSVPYTHMVRFADVEIEVIFLALDRDEDVRKLLSIEFTGIWINEAREVPKSIIDACTMRVGRFPSRKDGGPSWYGVIMDTNAPDEDHWWAIMSGEVPLPEYLTREEALMLVRPDDWSFYSQPSALNEVKSPDGEVIDYKPNPKAENKHNLVETYYPKLVAGKTKSWIDVYVMNRIGNVVEGKSVYANFAPEIHMAREPIPVVPNQDLIIGMDFGLTPAAVFCQRLPTGRWLVLAELVASNMGAEKFSQEIKHVLAKKFPDHFDDAIIYGDPSGDYRAQTDEKTPFSILRAAGLKAYPAPSNDPSIRIDSVDGTLTRVVQGKPGFLLDPSCTILKRGFEGGYAYMRVRASGATERYHDAPDKNKFSHIHDALQYAMIGGGESRKMMGRNRANVVNAKAVWDPFDRQKERMSPQKKENDKWERLFRRGI